MHIVVFGLGAIGGFYGTSIARYLSENLASPHRLSFVARSKTYDALKFSGAKLICKRDTLGEMQESIIIEKNFSLVNKYQDLDIKVDEFTLVLLCVKSKDTIEACKDIKTKLTENTAVVSVQNGVENEARIAEVLGTKYVVGSLTSIAAETLEPGIYLQKGNYGFILGELEANKSLNWGESKRIDYICNFLKDSGLSVSQTENIYKELWTKIVWNAAFNPISVLYENTTGQLLEDPKKKSLIEGIMFEVLQVAEAEGYKLAADTPQKQIEKTSGPIWYDFRTSMLQDFQKGRTIELDDILGVILRKADIHGLAVPNSLSVFDALSEKLLAKA